MLGKRKWKESVNWQRSDEVNSVLQKVILKYKVIQVKKIRNIVKLLFTSLLHMQMHVQLTPNLYIYICLHTFVILKASIHIHVTFIAECLNRLHEFFSSIKLN